ncbi:MAG: penicillin-binding protein activator [Magnetococcales bacterium]|nr:penicillin-binding protein activator [Magnetococcales bacterium]
MAQGDDADLLNQANMLAIMGDHEQAAGIYEQITQQFPRSPSAPEAHVKLAEHLLKQGRLSAAKNHLQEVIQRGSQPWAGRGSLLLGELFHHQENLQEAWRIWSQLSLLDTPEANQGWEQLLQSYFLAASPESTAYLLATLSPQPLSASQSRSLFQVASRQPKQQVELVISLQPATSPLLPQLLMAKGDLALQAGDEVTARTFWSQATLVPETLQEAQFRLYEPQPELYFKVGLILPLSGRHQVLGKNLLHAAQKALADYRDVPLTLEVADSGGSAEVAQAAVVALQQKKVQVIIGPVLHAAAKAAAVQAANFQIPIMVLNPRDEIQKAGDNVFQNALDPQRQAKIMAHYAIKEREFLRFAILAPDSSYGHLMADSFAQEVMALKGTIVRTAFFNQESPDFSPWIKALTHLDPKMVSRRLNMARRATPLDPSDPLPVTEQKDLEAWADFDALFLPTLAKQIRLIAPQAAFYNIRSPQVTLLGTSRWNRQSLFEGGTEYLQGAIFPDTDLPLRDQFRMAFRQAWEEDPSGLATLTYDGVSIIAQLLRNHRMGGPDWITGLSQPTSFAGASGPIRFLKSGESQRPYRLFQVDKRGVTTLPMTKNIQSILTNREAVIQIPQGGE